MRKENTLPLPQGALGKLWYVCTMDLHVYPGGLPSHVSQGLAPTFLRSTYPWVEAGIAPLQGLIARMDYNPSSFSVLGLSTKIVSERKYESKFDLL